MASKKELRALITLAGKVDPSLQSALLKASAQASKASSKFSKIGSLAASGLKAAGKVALAAGKTVAIGIGTGAVALGGLAMKASENADTLMKLKDKTGLSAEELQRLQYISGQLGANFESLPQAIGIMTKQMDAARKGSKDTAAAFKALGIQVTDGTGKLRPQSQVFQEALVQLSKIENQADRNVLAYKLFGRGAADLFPILNAGTDEIKKLAAEADKLGLVMSEDTVAGLDQMGDTIDKLKSGFKGFGNRLIAQLLPKVQPILDSLVDKLPAISNIFSGIGGEFLSGIADLLPQVLEVASQLIPVITPVLKMISGTLGPMLINVLQQALPVVMQLVQTALPLFNEAFSMLMSIIQPLLPDLMQLIQQILPIAAQFINMILQALKPFIPVLVQLVQALLPPLMQILQSIMPYLEALTSIIAAVANVIGNILGKAIELVTPLLQGLGDIISKVYGGLSKVIGGIGKFLGLGGKSVDVQANVSGDIPKYASGGFANRPSIFGEAGLEAAIPIERTPRSLGLLNQTARMIGAAPAGSSVQFTYAPVIYGGNRAELEPLLQKHKEEIQMILEDLMEGKARVAYGY